VKRPDRVSELIARARSLAERFDLSEPIDAIRRKKRRRRVLRRTQTGALVAILLAALTAGAFALRSLGSEKPARPGGGSPGGLIAYVSRVTGDNDIWVSDVDGRTPKNLTNDPANDFSPAWSPDGTRIAFSKWRGADRGIFVMRADGSRLTRLSTGSDFGAAWSPDGSGIAFSRGHGIWLMAADGADPHEITHSEGGDRDPSWSPDGSIIAFSRGQGSIVIVSVDGSGPVAISGGGSDAQPAWSPDGTTIAFQRNDDLYVMGIDGSAIRQLTFGNGAVRSRQPSWSPDGTTLVYSRDEGSTQTLATIRLDGSGARSLDDPGGGTFAMSPSWQPLPSS
jgi:TolB protein